MTAAQASGLLTLALNEGQSPGTSPPFGRLLILSLSLHCVVLALLTTVRFSEAGPKPLTFQVVSLVTLSTPSRAVSRSSGSVAKAELVKNVSKDLPVPQKANLSEIPAASTPPEATSTTGLPEPTPILPWTGSSVDEDRARSETLVREALDGIRLPPDHPDAGLSEPEATAKSEALLREVFDRIQRSSGQSPGRLPETDSRSRAMMRDALNKIELPPEIPTFENLASVPTITPTPTVPSGRVPAREPPSSRSPVDRSANREVQRQVDTILGRLKVPDLPTSLPPSQNTLRTFEQRQQRRSSLAEDMGKELRAIRERQRTNDTSVGATDEPPKGPEAVPPQVARKPDPAGTPARLETPRFSIQAPGASSGSSQYLALVQHKVSSRWEAPRVELTVRSLVVVVKFRLHRSGKVSDVVVEEPSGNPYYDLAARRAVVRAEPLPSFPRNLRESYLNINFTFAVREQLG